MTIQDVLKSAFDPLLKKEERMNEICDHLGEADENEMEVLMEELGTIQDELTLHDFYTIDAKVEEVARALGLLDLGLDRDVTDLSGGQRTKVLLAKLLLEKPDILLLDEPTNYLDEEHIAWLKRYLLDYENAFILISHDIPFLNEVVNIIYHMENQELNRYVGDYDHFQEVYAVKKSQLEAAYRRQQQEISELKDFVARNKARVSTRNMAMSRQKKLDKMDVIELAAEKPKPEFHFRYGRTPGRMLFETHDLVTGYDEPLSKPLNLSMERGQKIAITGTNGIGKTTLLKSILGLIPSLSGSCELGENLQIGYFEQEVRGDNRTTCIEELWQDFPSYTQYEIRSALAKCGLTTKHIESQVRVLSGGEQAKVRLCKLINRDTNVLLLDEPTNHLDAESVLWLEQHLASYQGAVIAVTHDRYFLDHAAEWICEVDRGQLFPYKGNYSTYLETKAARMAAQGQAQAKLARRMERELEWVRSSPKARQAKSKARLANYDAMVAEAGKAKKLDFAEIQIPAGPRLGSKVLVAKNLHKEFDGRVLIDDLSFELPRNGIVGVIGPNGVGKTTLFKTIVGLEPLDGGELEIGETVKIAYVDQNRAGIDPDKKLWEVVSGGTDYMMVGETEVPSRAYVAAFGFKGADQQKPAGVLSGGERNRLNLALTLKEGGNLLLLDEPTNDLDVETLSSLEAALLDFPGCSVVVSHDRMFLDRIATHILAWEGDDENPGRWHFFEGNFEAYQADREARLGTEAAKPHRLHRKLTRD